MGVVVNILNYNTTSGSSVTNSNITLNGTTNISGGYLNIIGSYVETIPNAPTSVTASTGNTQAIINWTASTNNGGSAITSYTVTSSPGNFQATTANGSTTTTTVSGLTNGTAYTFTVVATNVAGPSAASAVSTPVTPFTVPEAPTNIIATATNAQAIINWTAPVNNGGSAITSYIVTSSPGNFQATTANGSTTTATISGLTNGTAYTFTVLATNVAGSSPASIATNYENFNNSSKSFRIYCDKLTSNDTSNNLRLTSSNNNIELKVIDEKKIIFKNDVIFNSSMDFNNKPLTGLTSISAESLNINNILSNTNFNIGFSYKSVYSVAGATCSLIFFKWKTEIDCSFIKSFFKSITNFNNFSFCF